MEFRRVLSRSKKDGKAHSVDSVTPWLDFRHWGEFRSASSMVPNHRTGLQTQIVLRTTVSEMRPRPSAAAMAGQRGEPLNRNAAGSLRATIGRNTDARLGFSRSVVENPPELFENGSVRRLPQSHAQIGRAHV